MKKRGAFIKNKIAARPNGVKSSGYELSARTAVLAFSAGCNVEQHSVDLMILAELCAAGSTEKYVRTHSDTVGRLTRQYSLSGDRMTRYDNLALGTSVEVLLEWFQAQSNSTLAKLCLMKANSYYATRKNSLIEATANTTSGFIVALLLQTYVINPLFGLSLSGSENILITVIYTVVSIARSYVWRRVFNKSERKLLS